MGAAVRPTGVRFSVFSRHGTRVRLALFNDVGDTQPAHEIEFHPEKHRIGDMWSMFVEGLGPSTLYAYRVDGPSEPERGHRFDPGRYLVDPASRAYAGCAEEGTLKSVVVAEETDWFEDLRPKVPMHETIIYETHVRGLTVDGSAAVEHPGAYAGLIEKIPYLKDLGITSVELLPIQELGQTRLVHDNPIIGEKLANYWAYNPIGFFAPTARYAADKAPGGQLLEFRRMVAALHEAGLEVILDVVFNHTAEYDETGPTLCFRGLDNSIYYLLDEHGGYLDLTGCGNTLNCNHPLVRDLILDCLRYWVAVMHVDGFRFDLASILGRDRAGRLVENAPLIERIAEDPILRNAKLIAEAWDAAGAYQVGAFGDGRWADWNGRYRDEVRRFWHGDAGVKWFFAARMAGSPDVYRFPDHTPQHTINFITAHDGFTLRDLVSYETKRNEANGEDNRDGADMNYSWNCGVEGETDAPAVLATRLRMQKNFLATLFLSLGVPMMLGGDELGRTQQGNNNAYCQDNAISWYDWTLLDKYKELHRFCKHVIRLRKSHPVFVRPAFLRDAPDESGAPSELTWRDASGASPNWDDGGLALACWISGTVNAGVELYMMFNASMNAADFALPPGPWRVLLDTAQPPPGDCPDEHAAASVGEGPVHLAAKSMVVLAGGDVGSRNAR